MSIIYPWLLVSLWDTISNHSNIHFSTLSCCMYQIWFIDIQKVHLLYNEQVYVCLLVLKRCNKQFTSSNLSKALASNLLFWNQLNLLNLLDLYSMPSIPIDIHSPNSFIWLYGENKTLANGGAKMNLVT